MFHQSVEVRHSPLLHNLPVRQAKDSNLLNPDLSSRGCDPSELPSLGAGRGESYDNPVALRHYVVYVLVPIGKRGPVFSHFILDALYAAPLRPNNEVAYKVRRVQLVCDSKVAATLQFLFRPKHDPLVFRYTAAPRSPTTNEIDDQ